MPFGLVNAPAELQRQVNRDFEEPINEGWMVVYMDDVLVSAKCSRAPTASAACSTAAAGEAVVRESPDMFLLYENS